MKKLFFTYQKAMWYSTQARNEIFKLWGPFGDYALLTLYLANFGIQLSVFQSISIFITFLLGTVVFGFILTRFGVVKYNTELSNKENATLQLILEKLNETNRNNKRRPTRKR